MKYIYLLITMLAISCKPKDIQVNNNTKVIGHGGMGIQSTFPLNSVESVLQSIHTGVDGIELDIQMSKDGILIAYHDDNLSKTSLKRGNIYDYNIETLEQHYYTDIINGRYKLYRLEELLSAIPNKSNHLFFFDCKLNNYNSLSYMDSFQNAIDAVVNNFNLKDRVFIENIHPQFLAAMGDRNYKVVYYAPNATEGLALAQSMQLYGLSLDIRTLNQQDVTTIHQQNLKIIAYNLHNKSNNKKAIELGIDYLQTDMINYLKDFIER